MLKSERVLQGVHKKRDAVAVIALVQVNIGSCAEQHVEVFEMTSRLVKLDDLVEKVKELVVLSPLDEQVKQNVHCLVENVPTAEHDREGEQFVDFL